MTFMQDDHETPVIFRADRGGDFKDNITAVFPCEPYDQAGYDMACYARMGQHAGCSQAWYATTRAATHAEYADLQRELESAPYGYRLKIYSRIQPWMRETRRCAVNQQRKLA